MGNIDLLEDACAKLPHTTRRMFGGHGLFAPNGGMFAGIVTDDEIVFKLAEEGPRSELIALGGHPWVYQGKMTMKDWIVIPERFYDEPHELTAWAKRAHAIAPGKVVKPKAAKAPKDANVAKGAKAASPPTSKASPKKPTPAKTAPPKAPAKKAPPKKASKAPKAAPKKPAAKKKR